MSSTASQLAPGAAPAIVLDTNVVLDWLVFRNSVCGELQRLFEAGDLRWIVSTDIRGELEHVLSRGVGASYSPDLDALWTAWSRFGQVVDTATTTGPASRIRCTDPDDQKFIDLALAHGAKWLLTRDRAVLKIAKRTRPLGLEVLTPERWLAAVSPAR